jgi:hypothetical protein
MVVFLNPRKRRRELEKKRFLLVLAALVLVLAFLVLYQPALKGLGNFLAPQGTGKAEAAWNTFDQVKRSTFESGIGYRSRGGFGGKL